MMREDPVSKDNRPSLPPNMPPGTKIRKMRSRAIGQYQPGSIVPFDNDKAGVVRVDLVEELLWIITPPKGMPLRDLPDWLPLDCAKSLDAFAAFQDHGAADAEIDNDTYLDASGKLTLPAGMPPGTRLQKISTRDPSKYRAGNVLQTPDGGTLAVLRVEAAERTLWVAMAPSSAATAHKISVTPTSQQSSPTALSSPPTPQTLPTARQSQSQSSWPFTSRAVDSVSRPTSGRAVHSSVSTASSAASTSRSASPTVVTEEIPQALLRYIGELDTLADSSRASSTGFEAKLHGIADDIGCGQLTYNAIHDIWIADPTGSAREACMRTQTRRTPAEWKNAASMKYGIKPGPIALFATTIPLSYVCEAVFIAWQAAGIIDSDGDVSESSEAEVPQ